MIDVYSWATPNGHKVHIMLEETGLEYNVHAINIGAGAQFTPEYLKISPNNKIPAIVDPAGPDGQPISIFEVHTSLAMASSCLHRISVRCYPAIPGAQDRQTLR